MGNQMEAVTALILTLRLRILVKVKDDTTIADMKTMTYAILPTINMIILQYGYIYTIAIKVTRRITTNAKDLNLIISVI